MIANPCSFVAIIVESNGCSTYLLLAIQVNGKCVFCQEKSLKTEKSATKQRKNDIAETIK